MGLEIIAYSREDTCISRFLTYSLEVKLWSCYWQKLKNHIEEEEGTQEDEPSLVCLWIATQQVEDERGTHHIIVRIIPHAEGLTPEGAVHYLMEHQCWLTSKERLVYPSINVVKVRQLATEIVSLWIPGYQSQQGRTHPQNA